MSVGLLSNFTCVDSQEYRRTEHTSCQCIRELSKESGNIFQEKGPFHAPELSPGEGKS